jgi:hypothetical protein
MGVHEVLVSLVINFMNGDNNKINENLVKLAGFLNINPELLTAFSKIALSAYNPDITGIREADGNLIMNIKQLFKCLFPSISVEIFDDIAQIILENDPRPLLEVIKKRNCGTYQLQAFIKFIFGNQAEVRESVNGFIIDKMFNNSEQHGVEFLDMFKLLNNILNGDIAQLTENENLRD